MAGATIDTIAVVPSTRRPQGPHPLAEAIALTTLDRELAPLLTRGQGTATHLRADDTAFAAAGAARGRSVLLVDDTFTTGARMQSAASALTLAGARVVAGVPLGRVIDVSDPDRYLEKLALWRRQRAAGFSFDTCCLE